MAEEKLNTTELLQTSFSTFRLNTREPSQMTIQNQDSMMLEPCLCLVRVSKPDFHLTSPS
jgi:hypothetical protein